MKKTLYQLTTRNRSIIANSKRAGCIECHKIFPASEALNAVGWPKKTFGPEVIKMLKEADIKFPDEDTLYCPECDKDNCVVGDHNLPVKSFELIVKKAFGVLDLVAIEYTTIDIEHPEKYKGKLYLARSRGVGLPNERYDYYLLTEQETGTQFAIVDKHGIRISDEFPSEIEGNVLTSETFDGEINLPDFDIIEVTNALSCDVEGEERVLADVSEKIFSNPQDAKEAAEPLYGVKSADWIPLNPEFPVPIFPQEDEETDTDQLHLNLDQDPDD